MSESGPSLSAPDPQPPPSSRKRKRNISLSSIPAIDPFRTDNDLTPSEPQFQPVLKPQLASRPTADVLRDSSPLSDDDTSDPLSRQTSPALDRVLSIETQPPGSSSPRTMVAKRLAHLDIDKVEQSQLPSHGISPVQGSIAVPFIHGSSNLKVEDMPKRPSPTREESTSEPPKKRMPPPRGIKSPPPGGMRSSPSKEKAFSDDSNSISEHSLFDLTALTWQDSEITGHLMSDPDDDGYGINGIGFKPTVAIAAARSNHRRKQINAWRTREEKDARERRAEKRRLASARERDKLDMEAADLDKKSVRFVT